MRLFGKKESKELVIYTMKGCDYCDKVKEALTEKNIEFVEKDIREHAESWSKAIALTDYANTPTVFFKDQYFQPGKDYINPEQLLEIIQKYKPSKYDYERRSFEKIKSMNYQLAEAFKRLDAKLNTLQQAVDSRDCCNTQKREEIEVKQIQEDVDKSTS